MKAKEEFVSGFYFCLGALTALGGVMLVVKLFKILLVVQI